MVDIDRATEALAKAKDRTDLNATLASFYSLHHSAFLPGDGDDSDDDEEDKKVAFENNVNVAWSKAKKGKLKVGLLQFVHCVLFIDHLMQADGSSQAKEPPSNFTYGRPVLQLTTGEEFQPILPTALKQAGH